MVTQARYMLRVLLLILGFAAWVSAQTSHIEAATRLLSEGNISQAETEARKALQSPKTHALALAMLGTLRLQQGKPDESAIFLRQALALNPNLIGARTTLGDAYAFSNKPDLAAKCFREVLAVDPNSFNARLGLLKLEALQRNFHKSLELAESIMPRLVQSDEGLAVLASNYAALNKKQELEGLFNYWQKLPEPSDEFALEFAGALSAQGLKDQAIVVLEEQESLVASHPNSDSALKLANAFLALGRLTNAEINAELALTQKPDCVACYQTLAQIAERQDNGEKALSYLVQAKHLAPNNPEVLYQFGSACLERNLLDDALPALTKAVELRPDNDPYLYALGSADVGKGRLPDALKLFERLLQKHSGDASLMYAIGAVYFLQGKFNEAESSLKQCLSVQAEHVPAAYYLALTYDAMGDDDRAVPILRHLLENNPQHVPSYVKLGGILVRQHQYQEAQIDLQRALSLDPNSSEAHYQLGLALRRLGRPDESASHFAESQRLENQHTAQRDLHLRLLLPD